jgi:hypothetical protein
MAIEPKHAIREREGEEEVFIRVMLDGELFDLINPTLRGPGKGSFVKH